MHFQTEGFCMASSQQKPEHQGLQSHDQHGLIAFTKPFSWNVWKKGTPRFLNSVIPSLGSCPLFLEKTYLPFHLE
jgi:hypothetical protein